MDPRPPAFNFTRWSSLSMCRASFSSHLGTRVKPCLHGIMCKTFGSKPPGMIGTKETRSGAEPGSLRDAHLSPSACPLASTQAPAALLPPFCSPLSRLGVFHPFQSPFSGPRGWSCALARAKEGGALPPPSVLDSPSASHMRGRWCPDVSRGPRQRR